MTEQLELKLIGNERVKDIIQDVYWGVHREKPTIIKVGYASRDAQLQADKIVMGNVKRAMKKELENLNYSTDYVDYLLVDRVKLKAFWEKWLGENK